MKVRSTRMNRHSVPDSASRRLLVLTPFPPRLDATHGGARVMAELLMELSVRQCVALISLRGETEPPVDERLWSRCEHIEEVPRPHSNLSGVRGLRQRAAYASSLLRGRPIWVTDWTVLAFARRVQEFVAYWQPDIVQLEYHLMGQYVGALSKTQAARVLVEHEPGYNAVRSWTVPGTRRGALLRRLDLRAWRRYERRIIENVQTVVTFTERDRSALLELSRRTPIVSIPLGINTPASVPDPVGGERLNLLFFGNYFHPPNVDAALRLARDICPRLYDEFPELQLFIVGDRPPPELQELANERVIVTGWVANIDDYLQQASAIVVPIRLGGGMRVKVMEALAAGKAIVASRVAIEGIDVTDGKHVLLADEDEEFARKTAHLLRSPERRNAMGEQAHAWAHSHITWERVAAAYDEVYRNLQEASPVD